MKDIKINDMNEEVVLDAEAMEAVKGGPAYVKFDGVDGECRVVPAESLSLNFEKISFRR